jgi:NitT/TauT family transport system substrate-binding protein
MLKMMEGFIKRDEIKIVNVGTHRERLEAVRQGKVKAASLQEPWISVAEAQGARVIIESHSTRSEAAGDELDGPTLQKMFRAEARAAEAIQSHPEKYAYYIVDEAGGLIGLKELKLSRILNAPPTPYTRERFDDNYNWTVGWGLVPPGATYENTVDNRAWQ